MEKIKSTLEQYQNWKDLQVFIDRIEGHFDNDFSVAVENAKALLESIGKEICEKKNYTLTTNPTINVVLKQAFICLGYSSSDLVTSISGSLANIGQNIGSLRNQISPTSHGKTIDELRERNSKIDSLTRSFIIDSTSIVASLMICAFEERNYVQQTQAEPPLEEKVESLNYEEFEEFNAFWDESFGEFEMGEYSFSASEILFGLDFQAYVEEMKEFTDRKDDIHPEEEI